VQILDLLHDVLFALLGLDDRVVDKDGLKSLGAVLLDLGDLLLDCL
jgi:hypothetical protein